jgi:acid phosphatase
VNKRESKGWSKHRSVFSIIFVAIAIFIVSYLAISFSDSAGEVQSSRTYAVPDFSHIVIIVEENRGTKSIMNNPDASYINSLARENSYASQYLASGHPSLPNYMIITSGTTGGVRRDCDVPSDAGCKSSSKNIADLVESSGRTWKAYFEDMPSACYGQRTELYDPDYNPFIYYKDIADNTERCAQHVVPLTQLSEDINSANGMPDLVFISPNICNDMHNCPVAIGDEWLAKTATSLLDSPMFTRQKSLLIVMWDESEKTNPDNHIPFILAGGGVNKSYVSDRHYGHINLLKTIEVAWQLPPLNQYDKKAVPMDEFFSQQSM